MGILGKFAFWKKNDDFDMGKDLGLDKDLGMDMNPSSDLGHSEFGQNDFPEIPQTKQFQKYPSSPSFSSSSPNLNSSLQSSYPPSSYQQQGSYPQSNDDYIHQKNLEVISSKLDAVKAALESINQRLANLEAIARGEEEQRRKRYY